MPDFVDWEIEPEQYALILGLVRGERRDYAQSALQLGLSQADLAEGVVQYLLSSGYGGDLARVIEDLGTHPQKVLQAAFAMFSSDEIYGAVVLMRERGRHVFAPYAEWIEWRLAGGRAASQVDETRVPNFNTESGNRQHRQHSDENNDIDKNDPIFSSAERPTPVGLPFRKVVGRYVIRKMIWAGGQGAVYRADDLERGRPVAVKIERRHQSEQVARHRPLLAEAAILHELKHPGILPVLDSGVQEGYAFLVTKLCEGDLAQVVQRERPSHAEASQAVVDLARTLSFVHGRGFIHRDIKPGNVLVDHGSILLGDFGLAVHDSETQPSALIGTPPYMSPEQIRGGPVDQRTDIYSLGILFYELLTGQLPFSMARHNQLDSMATNLGSVRLIPRALRPFRAVRTDALLQLIKESPPLTPREIDSSIPVTLEDVCLRALAKERTDRFQSAEEMASKIRRWQLTSPRWMATWVRSRFRSIFRLGDEEVRQTIETLEQSIMQSHVASSEAGSRIDQGHALASLGLVYASIGDQRRAVSYHEQALNIFEAIGDRTNVADTSWNLSLSLQQLGESERAVHHAEIALRIYEEIADESSAAEVRARLAMWKAAG